jgi:IclR family transcriptional regulator, pca regulon regulatory protein
MARWSADGAAEEVADGVAAGAADSVADSAAYGPADEPVSAGAAAFAEMPDTSVDRLFIGSIGKCFQVLEALSADGQPMTLTALSAASGLDRSATQRITHTLGRLGYLRQHPDTRAWSLGTRLLEFGHTVLANDRLRECALPLLEALNQRTGETVNLMKLEGHEIVYVARFPSRHAVSVDLHVGSRLPAYCTAAGRSILARMRAAEARALLAASRRTRLTERTTTDLAGLEKLLARARADGYSVNDQEAFVGDLSVAAAVVDRSGAPVGAINIAVPTPRWQRRTLERELAPLVVATAREISVEFAS